MNEFVSIQTIAARQEQEIVSLKAEVARLCSERDSLSDAHEEAVDEAKHLRRENNRLYVDIEMRNADNAALRAQAERDHREANMMIDGLFTASVREESLRAQVAELRAALDPFAQLFIFRGDPGLKDERPERPLAWAAFADRPRVADVERAAAVMAATAPKNETA